MTESVPFAPPAAVSPKSRTVAAILGFFLGGLGVDRFYLCNIGMGVAKLLVGWLTLGIWPLVDWIIILVGSAHDGDGLPVTNWN
jgi:TM2 domain-containing membrane protein YozV